MKTYWTNVNKTCKFSPLNVAIVVVALQELLKPEPIQTNLKTVEQRSKFKKRVKI